MNGLFFVIEGGDGSGKATQTKLLEDSLRILGHNVLHQEFPSYGTESAYVTEQYLGKKYGKLSAQAATILYTVNRFDKWKTEIEPHLNPNQLSLFTNLHNIICSDRWFSANKGHQAGKGKTPEERREIINYINYIEHEIMGLPYATETILLDVHPVLGQRLAGIGKNTKIVGKDLHEEDINHLLNARQAYQEVAKLENWTIINAMRKPIQNYNKKELLELPIGDLLRPKEEIHKDVFNSIKKYL